MLTEFNDRMTKSHQYEVLVEDMDNPAWEIAHLNLFCVYADLSTEWGQAMMRLRKYYLEGEEFKFGILLQQMKDMV